MSGQPDETEPVDGQGRQPERAPARQTESIGDLATDPTTKAYTKFLTAVFALVGAAAGLGVLVVSFIGGNPLSSGLLDLASSQVPQITSMMDQLYVNRLAFQVINGAPVAAGVLGVAGGLYTASTLDGSDRHTYVAAGIGGAVGAFVLVAVAGVLASFAISPVPIPEQVQQAAATQTGSIQSVSGAISLVYIGGTDLAFQTLALNAVGVGVGVGVVSAASAYVGRELTP